MHRSGTSLVAGLVGKCGVSLGNPRDLMAAHAVDNPAGYWENTRFVQINDSILELFGGSWMSPPRFPTGWLNDPRLSSIRSEAVSLIGEISQAPVWGWKDPRTCLTLAFWQSLIPNLEYIVCVREPIDVMHSLAVRIHGFVPHDQALTLWRRYYNEIFPLTQRELAML